MYPILLVLAFGIAIALERYIYLTYVRTRNKGVWKRVLPLLESGKYAAAREVILHSDAAVSRILRYGLNRAEHRGSGEEIQMAMEEGLLEVVPRLEKRTHYLATLANIATLLGLLGTIIGLTEAFSTVAAADPADKANQLSASISIAMNTTAFGLMVAIPMLLIHAVMQTKTSELVDTLEMVTVRLSNLVSGAAASDRDAT
jgi:biopolymer transport protein ExbB/TolQ